MPPQEVVRKGEQKEEEADEGGRGRRKDGTLQLI
jgi:hypothetical protein